MDDHASTSISPQIPLGKLNTSTSFLLYTWDAYKSL